MEVVICPECRNISKKSGLSSWMAGAESNTTIFVENVREAASKAFNQRLSSVQGIYRKGGKEAAVNQIQTSNHNSITGLEHLILKIGCLFFWRCTNESL